jgi:hypothetical protein
MFFRLSTTAVALPTGFPKTYAKVVKLLDSYKVPILPVRRDNYLLNYEEGLRIPTEAFQSKQTTVDGVLEAFLKYSELYDGLQQYIVPGYINGVPSELLQSFGSWLRANGLDALIPFGYLRVRACCFNVD